MQFGSVYSVVCRKIFTHNFERHWKKFIRWLLKLKIRLILFKKLSYTFSKRNFSLGAVCAGVARNKYFGRCGPKYQILSHSLWNSCCIKYCVHSYAIFPICLWRNMRSKIHSSQIIGFCTLCKFLKHSLILWIYMHTEEIDLEFLTFQANLKKVSCK